jgi:hypothetical protein
LDDVQVAVAPLRWLNPADDPLKTCAGVIKDDLDRIHALGGASCACTTTPDKLAEFRAQTGMQILDES